MKLTENQKIAIKKIIAELLATNGYSAEAKAWLKGDKDKVAQNKDHIARMFRYCELMNRGKVKRNTLTSYFQWHILTAAKEALSSKDKMTISDKTKATLGWAYFAEIVAADYDPISGKQVVLKDRHSPEELKKGKSNLDGYRSWFLKKEKAVEKPIKLSMDEMVDDFTSTVGC